MNSEFFRIAATKTADPLALEMLANMVRLAHELESADASFAERINANKAKRGEPPTKLSKPQKRHLSELAQDQIDLDAGLCNDFRAMESASQIIWAAHYALQQDLPNAQKFLKHYHPDDRPLGEEIVRLKSQLLEAAERFLKHYPLADEGLL